MSLVTLFIIPLYLLQVVLLRHYTALRTLCTSSRPTAFGRLLGAFFVFSIFAFAILIFFFVILGWRSFFVRPFFGLFFLIVIYDFGSTLGGRWSGLSLLGCRRCCVATLRSAFTLELCHWE